MIFNFDIISFFLNLAHLCLTTNQQFVQLYHGENKLIFNEHANHYATDAVTHLWKLTIYDNNIAHPPPKKMPVRTQQKQGQYRNL